MTELAPGMTVFAAEHLLVGSSLYGNWNPNLVQQLLSLMQPDSKGMRIDVQSSQYADLCKQLPASFGVRAGTHLRAPGWPLLSRVLVDRLASTGIGICASSTATVGHSSRCRQFVAACRMSQFTESLGLAWISPQPLSQRQC